MTTLTETDVEAALVWLSHIGWQVLPAPEVPLQLA